MPPRPKSSSSSSPRTENPDIRESMRVMKVPRDVKNLLSLSCERRFTRLSVRMPMPFNAGFAQTKKCTKLNPQHDSACCGEAILIQDSKL